MRIENVAYESRVLCGVLVLVAATATMMQPAQGQAAAKLNLMPWPQSVTVGQGDLVLGEHFHAGFSGSHDERLDDALGRFLVRLDRECGGIRRAQYNAQASDPLALTLQVAGPGEEVQSLNEDESYKLNVTGAGAMIAAATDMGAMHGLETFLQLVEMRDGACRLPVVAIDDAPRFPWRGFMLDVSRHFMPIPVIERTLDGMAIAKLNVFHWHLSDEVGFRADSRKFPKLTGVASNGEFYTQDEMRHVVAYARARGIRVMPEFDVPAHSSSWVLAYPEIGDGRKLDRLIITSDAPRAELDPTNEKTYKFLDEFIGEMTGIFPDVYFHIGGDEVEGTGWKANAAIQAFMAKKGFKTNDELQAYFNQRLLKILTKYHKKMVGWDEILTPALPKDIMVQSWRGVDSLAAGAVQGYTGILSAPYYLDGQKTSEEMFLADPIPADTKLTAEQQKLIYGGEICMWAEQIGPETVDSRTWPRALAIAERFWSPQADRDVGDMYRRMRVASLELESAGLTHISGPQGLRRNLAGSENAWPLDVLASVTEPVSFDVRQTAQRVDWYTSLDRLVDAVVADPPARQEIAREVDAALSATPDGHSNTAEAQLRRRFVSWQQAAPALLSWTQRSGRLSDAGPRAKQLAALAQTGLESLAFLDTHTAPPAGWLESQKAVLKDAEQPGAYVWFVFLPSLGKLVEAAKAAR